VTTGEAVIVRLTGPLGVTTHIIPPLSADRGLEAAQLFIPYLMTLRPAIDEIAADRAAGRDGRTYTEIGLDMAVAILPQLKATDVLRLGELLTGISYEELAGAPLPETLEAIVTAGKAVDFSGLLATGQRLIAMMGQSGQNGGTPTQKIAP
jgi:hypothetical protein